MTEATPPAKETAGKKVGPELGEARAEDTAVLGSATAAGAVHAVARWIDASLGWIAVAILASMLAAAVHDVSYAWDVWYYHLPFAARIGGVVSASDFAFDAANRARFAGFPLLAESIAGFLWRVTGRAEAANLVAFACVPIFALFLRKRFSVPFRLTVLALLAVPLVHIHATSSYVDLPANTAVAILVLAAYDAYARASYDLRALPVAGAAAFVAVNTKALVHPVVLVALGAIFVRAVPVIRRDLANPRSRRRALGIVVVIALAAPIVFATPLANAVVHRNPYYPVRISILGHTLPGEEAPYASEPAWLAGAPRPVRFACSLLEVGIRPMTSSRRWTVDQWMPDDTRGNRMGGFFNAYVLLHLGILGWRVAVDRSRRVRVAGIGFAALTVMTSFMPQSHELRYYLYWMIVLVALNLLLAIDAKRSHSMTLRARVIGVSSVFALAVVLLVTRAGYAYPSGTTFADLVRTKVDDRAIGAIRDGEHVCVRHEPWNLLWAAPFHSPHRYSVIEADAEGDCEGYRPID